MISRIAELLRNNRTFVEQQLQLLRNRAESDLRHGLVYLTSRTFAVPDQTQDLAFTRGAEHRQYSVIHPDTLVLTKLYVNAKSRPFR